MPVLGKIGLVNRGTYSASATYTALDFVLYNGSSFVALKNVKGVAPSNDGTNWQTLAEGTAASMYLEDSLTYATAGERALDAAQGPVIKALIDAKPSTDEVSPKNHASTSTTYGLGTASNYGHVKMSDTYSSKQASAAAANGIGASQNALYNAYTNRAPIAHASTGTTYGQGNASNFGHVKLSDTYATKQSSAAAANGVAASQNALYNAYAAVNGKADRAKLLAHGLVYYMTDTQTVTLSEAVSAQAHGIVLHWQGYNVDTKSLRASDHSYTFIPKSHVSSANGQGIGVVLMSADGSAIGRKYVYVNNTQVIGNKNNNAVDTVNGITFKNNYWVLTQVIGV